MACHEIHSWTFCGLVGAFLDLGLAYLLLCGSTLSFFTSKFLGIFGLQLPCPCNGLFGYPYGGKCLQRLLVEYPSRNISSIQVSVMNKFPFNSIWMNDQGCQVRYKLLGGTERCETCDGPQEMEGEASCSSISDARGTSQTFAVTERSHNSELGGFELITSASHDGRTEFKGKGVVSQKLKSGIRRRRRAVAEHRKSSSVSFCDSSWFTNREISHSPCSMSETGHEISEEGSVPVTSAGVAFQDDREGGYRPGERSLHDFEVNGSFGESGVMEQDALSVKELVRNVQDEQGFDGDEKNVIRVLEHALEEEKAARAALYLELEKERSAAATAADEAMAMIVRVQKEKASIEMEARQYLRIIEEKSAYDAEEMEILKEIVVRREKEKHFLEKEVETYRQLILLNNGGLEDNVNDMVEMSALRSNFLSDSSDDPVLMLQQISESIDKREIEKNLKTSSTFESETVQESSSFHTWDKDANLMNRVDSQRKVSSKKSNPHMPGSFDDCNQDIQEKGMVSMDEEPSVLQGEGQILGTVSRLYKLNSSPKPGLLEKTIISFDEGHGKKDSARQCRGVEMKADSNPSGTEINFPCDGEELEKHGKDADQGSSDQHMSETETEPSLYDVHVIDDKSEVCKEEARKENQTWLTDTDSDRSRIHGLPFDTSGVCRIDASTDQSGSRREPTEREILRSCSDLNAELPPISNIHGKSLPFELRRNSVSAVDKERLKLETEVGWLRERLRIVQGERETLSFPIEHREGEKIQLQLLEDIAKQLQEIRQLTEPGKTIRHASLPLTSSKASSKKRRCRSVSLGLHDST